MEIVDPSMFIGQVKLVATAPSWILGKNDKLPGRREESKTALWEYGQQWLSSPPVWVAGDPSVSVAGVAGFQGYQSNLGLPRASVAGAAQNDHDSPVPCILPADRTPGRSA